MASAHSKPSQCDRIAAWLRRGRSLKPLKALQEFGCFRLGARVHELKRAGMDIESVKVRTADGACVARYRIPRKPKPSASQRLCVSPQSAPL